MIDASNTIDFGTDISCTDDLDPLCRDVSGVTCVCEAILRRAITPLGWLLDDPFYGAGVYDMLSEQIADKDIPSVAARLQAQFLQDERIERVLVRITRDTIEPTTFRFDVSGRSSEGPFELTRSISTVTGDLLKGNS